MRFLLCLTAIGAFLGSIHGVDAPNTDPKPPAQPLVEPPPTPIKQIDTKGMCICGKARDLFEKKIKVTIITDDKKKHVTTVCSDVCKDLLNNVGPTIAAQLIDAVNVDQSATPPPENFTGYAPGFVPPPINQQSK